jgi:glycosyltransferase involved in cell wall biosynthesis
LTRGSSRQERTEPAVWFPTVRTHSGTDSFTERLVDALVRAGYRAQIDWLPRRAEFAPWSVAIPVAPEWANVVHAPSWLSTRFLPSGLPVVATVHLCVHDRACASYKSGVQALYHRCWIRQQEEKTLRHAAVVTAVSSTTAMQTARAFPGIKPSVIANGLDAPLSWQAPRPQRGDGPFRVLYCGNWSLRKGVDLLYPLLQTLGDGFELLYTPDRDGGTGGFQLPPGARSLGRLKGPEALSKAYRLADVLVFPSRLEGLPLVPIEAMACGLPIVATDGSSITDLVRNGETGFVVPAGDVAALADAIIALRNDPSKWSQLSAAAQRRQLTEFSEARMLGNYLMAYRQALESGPVRAARRG